MEEWKEFSVHDITRRVKVGFVGSCENDYCNKTETDAIPMIRTTDLTNYIIHFDNQKFVTRTFHEKNIKSQLHKHDLLIARHGDNGKTCIYESDEPANCLNVIIIEPDNNKCDYKFLKYMFDSSSVKNILSGTLVGSVQPVLNTKTVENLIINIPPLPIQKKIAAILSSLDDKIELNNKINTNLEQQAQAFFKNWFVDFEPFGGKMPEGWKVGKLGDFVEIKRGGSPRPIQKFLSDEGYRWLKISDVSSLSSPFVLNIAEHIKEEGLSKTVFLKAGSLVLSNSATPGIPKILDLDTCIHDGWLYFPKSQLSNEYLYLLFKEIRPQLVNLGNGSIFTNLKTDILKNFEISLPSTETLSKFQNIIKPIFEKVLVTQREIKQLETLRDTLLPKLMNGEI
ncbi:MAG: restriction endonuclease subunit S [Treponema sp.]|nr:restriction endonuclease subunit S [Treponema sp.]